jgi:hypothetical protein
MRHRVACALAATNNINESLDSTDAYADGDVEIEREMEMEMVPGPLAGPDRARRDLMLVHSDKMHLDDWMERHGEQLAEVANVPVDKLDLDTVTRLLFSDRRVA